MKKIITAVFLLAFCLQTAGCSALAAAVQAPADNEKIADSTNWDWDNYPSNSTSTKNAGSRTYEQKPQAARSVDITEIGNNPTSIKITVSMTEEQKQKAFKKIMKAKSHDDYFINDIVRYIQWDIIDENTIQHTVTFIDLLNKYGYDQYTICQFLINQKKITDKEFQQICENIELISGDKYKLSYDFRAYILHVFTWTYLAKPLAPSYLKLAQIDHFWASENVYHLLYINDEKIMASILENYNLMKETGVLYDKSIKNVIFTTDWNSYNGTNYALRLTNLMKETNLYSNGDINRIVENLDWNLIKNDPPASSKAIIQKGYIKYFFQMHGNILIDNTVLTNFEKILDLMKENNFDEYIIKRVISNSNWEKSDETLAILKILVEQKKTSSKYIATIFLYPKYQYTIYETVMADNSIKDKNKEIIKQFNKLKAKHIRYGALNKAGDVAGETAAGTVAVQAEWLLLQQHLCGYR